MAIRIVVHDKLNQGFANGLACAIYQNHQVMSGKDSSLSLVQNLQAILSESAGVAVTWHLSLTPAISTLSSFLFKGPV